MVDGNARHRGDAVRQLARNELAAPIHVMPGDRMVVDFIDKHRKITRLAEHTIAERCVVDTAVVVELEENELTELDLVEGMAGIVGQRRR